MKLDKLDRLFRRARTVAEDSHDSETQVGCLLVYEKDLTVLTSGYNGFIRGGNDAELPTTRPHKYPYVIHAEMNMLFNALRHQINPSGCFVVCTLSPCRNCLRSLWQCGISTIYFETKYKDFEEQISMKDLQINLTQVGKYYKLELETDYER